MNDHFSIKVSRPGRYKIRPQNSMVHSTEFLDFTCPFRSSVYVYLIGKRICFLGGIQSQHCFSGFYMYHLRGADVIDSRKRRAKRGLCFCFASGGSSNVCGGFLFLFGFIPSRRDTHTLGLKFISKGVFHSITETMSNQQNNHMHHLIIVIPSTRQAHSSTFPWFSRFHINSGKTRSTIRLVCGMRRECHSSPRIKAPVSHV